MQNMLSAPSPPSMQFTRSALSNSSVQFTWFTLYSPYVRTASSALIMPCTASAIQRFRTEGSNATQALVLLRLVHSHQLTRIFFVFTHYHASVTFVSKLKRPCNSMLHGLEVSVFCDLTNSSSRAYAITDFKVTTIPGPSYFERSRCRSVVHCTL